MCFINIMVLSDWMNVCVSHLCKSKSGKCSKLITTSHNYQCFICSFMGLTKISEALGSRYRWGLFPERVASLLSALLQTSSWLSVSQDLLRM